MGVLQVAIGPRADGGIGAAIAAANVREGTRTVCADGWAMGGDQFIDRLPRPEQRSHLGRRLRYCS